MEKKEKEKEERKKASHFYDELCVISFLLSNEGVMEIDILKTIWREKRSTAMANCKKIERWYRRKIQHLLRATKNSISEKLYCRWRLPSECWQGTYGSLNLPCKRRENRMNINKKTRNNLNLFYLFIFQLGLFSRCSFLVSLF
jgi:hypothetical protein